MVLETETRTTRAQKEISQAIIFAAKHVSIEDFLQIRTESILYPSGEKEKSQILVAEKVLMAEAEKRGETYRITDRNKFTLDPKVAVGRMFLIDAHLSDYLDARHQGLKQEEVKYTNLRDYWNDDTGVNSIKVEEINNRLEILANEISLTERVAEKTGIILKLDAVSSK